MSTPLGEIADHRSARFCTTKTYLATLQNSTTARRLSTAHRAPQAALSGTPDLPQPLAHLPRKRAPTGGAFQRWTITDLACATTAVASKEGARPAAAPSPATDRRCWTYRTRSDTVRTAPIPIRGPSAPRGLCPRTPGIIGAMMSRENIETSNGCCRHRLA